MYVCMYVCMYVYVSNATECNYCKHISCGRGIAARVVPNKCRVLYYDGIICREAAVSREATCAATQK